MRRYRVLIVDDSSVVRRLIQKALDADPEIEVVGSAANGEIALAKIEQSMPDIVTLDVEMPVMSGIETLEEIRRRLPSLPVVMFSALTEEGAAATVEALSKGASDYVSKPSSVGRIEESIKIVRDALIPKIKALCGLAAGESPRWPPVHRPSGSSRAPSQVDVVAIGVSTGGPVALAELLPQLPADLRAPVLIVQHMPPEFTRHMAKRLDSLCALDVREASDGAPLRPGAIWLAPGGFHMEVEAGEKGALQLRVHQEAPENYCRPAVDPLFRSVAKHCGSKALAVVLTGMGSDGLRGCEAIHENGGQIVVQDEASSVVWGMPGFVAQADLPDLILPLDQIGTEIRRRVGDAAARHGSAKTAQEEV